MVNSSAVVIIIIPSKFKSAFPPSQLGSEKFPPDSELPKSLSLASQLLNNFTVFSRHCLPRASPRRGRFLLDGTWRLGSSSPPRPEAINHKPIPERHQHLKKSENVYTGKRSRRSWTVIHFTSWGGRDGCLRGCIVRRVTHASPPARRQGIKRKLRSKDKGHRRRRRKREAGAGSLPRVKTGKLKISFGQRTWWKEKWRKVDTVSCRWYWIKRSLCIKKRKRPMVKQEICESLSKRKFKKWNKKVLSALQIKGDKHDS